MNDTNHPLPTALGSTHDEIIDMIVSAHTSTDGMLESILRGSFPSPAFYDDAHLTFYQKLSLVRAKHWRHQHHAIWQLIKQLNALRNEVSHHPTPATLNQSVDRLFAICLDMDGMGATTIATKTPAQQLSHINRLIEEFLKQHISDSAFLNDMSRNLIKAFNNDKQKIDA